ncbi:regulator of nonsense transcripts 3B-like [Montipora capricornis]|uniref:regulator of nonsense transcripts 3B-like n=1 Tax=Montipora capricornis TaxID=246305 RepID=UPI0035F177E4
MGKSEVEKLSNSSKNKKERLLFPTKVVIRRLPPTLTEDQLREDLGGFPEHDFFYFVGGDMSFGPMSFSRAYINFKNRDDIVKFRDQFDGYCFVDNRGVEYPAVVEYAPYQGIPKKKAKKDPKIGTISEDPDYLAFLESLKETSEPPASVEAHLEEIESKKASSNSAKTSTPLLEYMRMKKSSRGKPLSARRTPEKKRRPEREELSKSPKKGSLSSLSSNKDSGAKRAQLPPKEEKPKDVKKDTKSKEDGRRQEKMDKKGNRETKATPPSKDKSPPKGKEEKGRPDSGRYGKRSDNRRSDDKRQEDRQTVNRRDRRDITESRGSDHGRDEHYRKESGNENGRNDQRPDSRRRRDISSESKPKDREPLSKTSDPGKDVKPCRELEREQGSPLMRETKDKESSAASNESKPPEEEAKGTTKYEKKGSESERRLRNKDRPDRAFYQPRTSSRDDPRPDTPKATEASPEKEKSKGKEKLHEPDRDTRRNRNTVNMRDRDRDDRREHDRDRRSDREYRRDKTRDRESEKSHNSRLSREKREDKSKSDANNT